MIFNGRGAQNSSATRPEVISETLSNDSGVRQWSQDTGKVLCHSLSYQKSFRALKGRV
jgi:hypothetical protein